MAEEAVVTSAAPPEVQKQAEEMGWIPDTRYKGDPEKFVDADEFIRRGETVLPILKKTNERLHREQAELRAANAQLSAAVKAAQEAIEDLKEQSSVATLRAAEKARADLKSELARASSEGDHAGVAEITEQLTKLNTAAPPVEKEKPTPPPAFQIPPEIAAWNAENPWFNRDKRRTSLFLGVLEELNDAQDPVVGIPRFEKAKAEVERILSKDTPPPREDKVDSPRGGDGGPRAPRGWASLPAEAKSECDKEAQKFVGKGKRYETLDAWRKRYVEIYTSME